MSLAKKKQILIFVENIVDDFTDCSLWRSCFKKETAELVENDPNLKTLIADMFETMYKAKGVGLAAPQIGKSIRLFIIDGSPFADEEGEEPDPKAEGIENFKKSL